MTDFACYDIDENFDYSKLDPGIREVVRWLIKNGFTTTDSGDGRYKLEHGWTKEELVPFPHVYMEIDPMKIVQECEHLKSTLNWDLGIEVVSQTEAWMEASIEATSPQPYIEVFYDPCTGKAIMGLFHVTSDMVRDALQKKLANKV